MRNFLLAAGVAALALAAPASADKGGKGGGGGKGGHAAKVERGGGKGAARTADRRSGGQAKARGSERRQARVSRAPERREARVKHSPERREASVKHSSERRVARAADRGQARVKHASQRHELRSAAKAEHGRPLRIARDDHRSKAVREHGRGQERLVRADRREDWSRDHRRDDIRYARADRRRDDVRYVQADRRDDIRYRPDGVRYVRRTEYPFRFASRDYGWRDAYGCPPGLARKGNGCLPPGQARKFVGHAVPAAFATSLLPSYYRNWYPDTDRYYYRTGDDFIYRIDRDDDLIDGYMPLFSYGDYEPDYYYVGEPYPMDYVSFYNVPVAYQSYYPDEDDWLYRYGDGAIYRVDPASGVVNAIVQLLAGDLAVGSPLPVGYDVYNVPYAYRDRYYDTPDHWYRYNDGYIYQVDPTTRIVQAVIQAMV